MKLSAIALAAALISGTAQASILKLDAGKSEKEGVNISVGATATVDGVAKPLTTVGSGLRMKKVFFNVKVYIAQLLVGDVNKYEKTQQAALNSLSQQPDVAMHLTFLRDVPMDKLTGAFEEGFAANNVSMTDADIVKFMSLVEAGGHGEEGGTLAVYVTRNADGSESLTYEVIRQNAPYQATMKGASGLAKKVFGLWLGVPADEYLGKLKTELMQ